MELEEPSEVITDEAHDLSKVRQWFRPRADPGVLVTTSIKCFFKKTISVSCHSFKFFCIGTFI